MEHSRYDVPSLGSYIIAFYGFVKLRVEVLPFCSKDC